jgi:prophage antirepressor-like protein
MEPLPAGIVRDGEPWFVLADVCKVLDKSNPSMEVTRLDEDEKSGVIISDPHGRAQETNIISESGLYSLVLTSRKPEAKVFKRWVTGTVLPTLRKTGTYTVPTALPAPELPTIDLTDSALVLAIITAPATKAIEEGKRAVTDTRRCRRRG